MRIAHNYARPRNLCRTCRSRLGKSMELVTRSRFVTSAVIYGILLMIVSCGAEWRNLSRITYHFTSCNSEQGDGPTFSQCSSYYEAIGSPIHRDGLLNDSPNQQGYPGGQGFVFPRTGWYNVTVAGAAGGRGLCNPEKGKGVVASGRLYVKKGVNDSVLVMAGQQGIGPCDLDPSNEFCELEVSNSTNAAECYSQWVNQTSSMIRLYAGGGSGGGASMLWPPNDNGQYDSSNAPYIVSGGGGGTSVQLNYAVFERPPGRMAEEYYVYIINGNYQYEGHVGLPLGATGNRPEGVKLASAGAGGGYFYMGQVALAIDGKSITRPQQFASGGVDCAEFHSQSTIVPFMNVIGGFGGGGGGCSEGGGGGGYTGGSVVFADFDIPGEGGFSFRGSVVDEVLEMALNDGDGYIKILPSDCGCADECELDSVMERFDCKCTSDTSHLAPDGFDCYNEEVLSVFQESVITKQPASYPPDVMVTAALYSLSEPVRLYSIQFTLANSAAEACALVWLDTNLIPVLTSNALSSPEVDEASYLARIHTTSNQSSLSSFVKFLQKSVTVSAVLVMSTGSCTITRATANISSSSPVENDGSGNSFDIEQIFSSSNITFDRLAELTLNLTAPPQPSSSSQLVLIAVLVPVLLAVAGIGILLVIILIVVLRSRKHKFSNQKQLELPFLSSGSEPSSAVTSPTYTPSSEQNVLLTSIQDCMIDNELYPSVKPYYTHFLPTAYEIPTKPSTDVSAIQHGYEVLNFDDADEKSVDEVHFVRSRKNTFTFRPKFGVIVPDIDFTEYNRQRSEKDWEYDRDQLIYLRDIGEGQFGKVLLMKAKNIAGYEGTLPVAVKTLSSTDEHDIEKFLEEAELMKKFCHPNIISLLGVNCVYSEGAPLMILEYMSYGDLQGFLTKHRPQKDHECLVTRHHLNKFARDVVNGLYFLEVNKYVHRDVAARNCLVGSRLQVKIADFGLARGVQQKDYYRIAGQAVLPVRWLAPESLMYGVFTSASDVWSYGVLLWEIVTYGGLPLENHESLEIVEMAQKGGIVHIWPEDGSERLGSIMQQCHNYNPEDRPTFSQILTLLPTTKSPERKGEQTE